MSGLPPTVPLWRAADEQEAKARLPILLKLLFEGDTRDADDSEE